jgi:hypothetical protein
MEIVVGEEQDVVASIGPRERNQPEGWEKGGQEIEKNSRNQLKEVVYQGLHWGL